MFVLVLTTWFRLNRNLFCCYDPNFRNCNMNQQSFVYNIPSIHQKRPGIPAALGNLDLNRQVAAGDPLDYQKVVHAKSVAAALQGLRGEP